METTTLRIIAGTLRTRKIQFAVDPRTRPMKDRTREAVMSLLGGSFDNMIAFDLFGGTGILAFESVSRGASHGIIFEILRNATKEIRTNAETLGIESAIHILQTDVLAWSEDLASEGAHARVCEQFGCSADSPWIIFCCPPYSLWDSDGETIHNTIQNWWRSAPSGSLFAIELEEKTPREYLPKEVEWDIRIYKPARLAIGEKP